MSDQQVLSKLELGRQAPRLGNGYRERRQSKRIWKTAAQSARMMVVLTILLLLLLPIFYLIALSLKTPDQILQTLFFPARPTPGLIFCYALLNVPVALWLLTGFMNRIPKEIDEAAALDGAGILMTLWKIIIPLISPGIVSTGIICAILNYDEFLFAFFFTSNPTRTLPIGVALFQGERLINFGQMAVASLVGIIPIYLVSIIFRRWLVNGLANASTP
jgi:ABC-type glycerol-3-phosphate transport system permease component